MKDDHNERRYLLIEQLELRSMLSGDLFIGFIDFADDDRPRRSERLSGERSFGRHAELREFDDDDDDRRQRRGRDRDHDRDDRNFGSGRFAGRADFNIPARSSQPEGELIEVTILIQVPVTIVPVLPTTQLLDSGPSTQQPTSPTRSFADQAPRAGNQGIVSGPTSNTLDGRPSAPAAEMDAEEAEQSPQQRDADVFPNSVQSTAERVTEPADATISEENTVGTDLPSQRVVPIRVQLTQNQLASLQNQLPSELINDLSVTNPTQLQRPLNEFAPWRISEETLDRLQETLQQSEEGAPSLQDAAVAWFVGPGGLIDFGVGTIQLDAPGNAVRFISVELDTALGLHRSLDLLAADVVVAEDASVRDAVLAALLSEELDTAQPLAETKPIQVPTLAYPSAALIATLAVASQRKRAKELELDPDKNSSDD